MECFCRYYIHPNYTYTATNGKFSMTNDIALISLTKKINVTPLVNPICLPDPLVFERVKVRHMLYLDI